MLLTVDRELAQGPSLDEDAKVEPSDPAQFYRIDEYVVDVLEGRTSASG